MSWMTVVALLLVGCVLGLVFVRLSGKGAPQSLDELAMLARLKSETKFHGQRSPLDDSYAEVLRTAEIELASGETVLAACGLRGETEMVLMATTHRVFLFSRRFASGKYHAETFAYLGLRPIPISQTVIGGTLRLLEGNRIAEMKSPGAESWMDTAEDTVRFINKQISTARLTKA